MTTLPNKGAKKPMGKPKAKSAPAIKKAQKKTPVSKKNNDKPAAKPTEPTAEPSKVKKTPQITKEAEPTTNPKSKQSSKDNEQAKKAANAEKKKPISKKPTKPVAGAKRTHDEAIKSVSQELPADSSDEEEIAQSEESDIDSEEEEKYSKKLGSGIKIKPANSPLDLEAFAKAKSGEVTTNVKVKSAIEKCKSKKGKGKKGTPEDNVVLYIGRLPQGFEVKEITSFFSQFGGLEKVKVSKNFKTAHSQNHGFLMFNNKEIADIVVETMNNYYLAGQLLQVKHVPIEQTHDINWREYTREDAKERIETAIQEHKDRLLSECNTSNYRKMRIAKELKHRKAMADAGISYTYNGYTEAFPKITAKITEKKVKPTTGAGKENKKAKTVSKTTPKPLKKKAKLAPRADKPKEESEAVPKTSNDVEEKKAEPATRVAKAKEDSEAIPKTTAKPQKKKAKPASRAGKAKGKLE